MKFLFAEDGVELSRAVCVTLRHQGNEVNPVYDGGKALRKVRAGSYDYVVTDMMMPRQDGISVVWTLRTEGNRTPVVILTAKTQFEDKITGLDAGVDDYLTKPFAMQELPIRVRSMAQRSGYQEEYIQAGDVTLDMGEQELKTLSSIRVGSKEVRLVEPFMWNPDKLLESKELSRWVWDENEESGDKQLFLYTSYSCQKLSMIQAGLLIEEGRGGSFVLWQRDT